MGPKEKELLKTHSKVGIHILGKADYLKGVRDVILQHHYRYDGKGNADGVKGEAIPLLKINPKTNNTLKMFLNKFCFLILNSPFFC